MIYFFCSHFNSSLHIFFFNFQILFHCFEGVKRPLLYKFKHHVLSVILPRHRRSARVVIQSVFWSHK